MDRPVCVLLLAVAGFVFRFCFAWNETTEEFDCCDLPKISLNHTKEYELTSTGNRTMARFTPSHKSAAGPFKFDAGQKHILVVECVAFEMKTVFQLENGLSDETIRQFRGRPCIKSAAPQAQGCVTFVLTLMTGGVLALAGS